METSANVPVCLPVPVSDPDYRNNIEDHCVFQDSEEKWQELQQFWVEEKHRLQDYESQTQQFSSSLERHLLFDECVQEPREEVEPKDDTSHLEDDHNCIVIHGDEIGDIPTQYVTTGFRPNELIVIGTYVDKRVIPGFKYKVRKNLTEKYFFGGEALRLEQIGQGYGKRLTFESPRLNKNKNYFWSDSCAAGFGFSIQAVSPGDVFAVYEPVLGKYYGRAVVTEVKGEQVEKSTVLGSGGKVEKIVQVSFVCSVVLSDRTTHQSLSLSDVCASGIAHVVKKDRSSHAEVESIELNDFVVKDCMLAPDN